MIGADARQLRRPEKRGHKGSRAGIGTVRLVLLAVIWVSHFELSKLFELAHSAAQDFERFRNAVESAQNSQKV